MTPRFVRPCLAALLVAAGVAAFAQPAAPPPAARPAGASPATDVEMVNELKLPDADLDTVLSTLEMLTGRFVLRPAQLQTATYNLKITKPISKTEAILAIETVLAQNLIGVTEQGDRSLIVSQLQLTRTTAPEMITGSTLDLPPSGKIATKIFQLDFLRVQEFAPLIQQGILNPNIQGVVMFQSANSVMVTDSVSNLQRIESLLKSVDRPNISGLTPKFYPLHNASATTIVNKLNTMLSGQLRQQIGINTTFSSDDRTNQIIVFADPRQYPIFDELVAKLDTPADPQTRNEVIFLKHAEAAKVADTLTRIIQGQNAAQRANSQNAPRVPQNITQPVAPVIPGAPPGAAPGPVAPAVVSSSNAGNGDGNGGSTNEFSIFMTIASDERSNSIVVSGTGDDIRLIKQLVDKLDVLLPQVSIQVVIAEVTLTDTDVSGLSALNLTVGTDTPAGAGGDNGRGTHITNFGATLGGWNVTTGVVNPLSFAAALQSNGGNSRVKVLQANTIITQHGKEGDFQVQQKQPYAAGVTSTPNSASTTGVTTQSNTQYINVGVEVKVTPLIGADGGIELKIDQIVDDILGNVTIDNGPVPIVGHREANVTVSCQDGQMIVLGGLQSNKLSTNRSKVGFFYEIPILSNLIGGRNNETDRRELLLFVKPHIIAALQGTADATQKIDELSEKDDIHSYLKDPSKMPNSGVIDRFVK